MKRCCADCRHYHELFDYQFNGTCHLKPPKHVDASDYLHSRDAQDWDAVELKRWPATQPYDTCGRYDMRCQYQDCRTPVHTYTEVDFEDSQVFCAAHGSARRRSAA